VVAKVNLILADLQKDFAIVGTRKPPQQGLTASARALAQC